MRKALRITSLSAILFGGLLGCLTPIEVKVEAAGGRLVVSGQISNISEQNVIQLGSTAELARAPFPVSDASITLFDNLGNSFLYQEDFDIPGRYILPYLLGIPGRMYHIEIVRSDGRAYKSSPEKMPEVTVPINSATYEIENKEIVDAEGAARDVSFVKLFSNFSIPSTAKGLRLKWSVKETFLLSPTDFPDIFGNIPPPCYIDQDANPQLVTLFDGSSVSLSSVEKYPLVERQVDWTFLEKHYFTIYQSAITDEAYEYWRRVNILANQSGSLFDTPPAEIVGNISTNGSDKPLGYFQAVNQSFIRFFLMPGDFPFPLLFDKCDFKGDKSIVDAIPNIDGYPTRCINCGKLPNNRYERPIWF